MTDVAGPLGQLEGAGMIELAATEPDLEYLFRHVLIQEAAYDSLLRQDRRRLHRTVAEAMESLYADRLEELAAVIAMHFEAAGESTRAIDYFRHAGEFALARFAVHEAKDAFDRARALVDGEATDEGTRRLRAEIDLGRVQAGATFVPADESLAILDSVLRDAEALDDERLLARALLHVALERTLRGEQYGTSPALRDALERGLELADRTGDEQLRAQPLALVGEARARAGDYEEAVAILEEAVPLLERSGRLDMASLFAGTLATSHGRLGRFDRAIEWVDRATDLGGESGDPTAILDADLARAMIEAGRGRPAVAIDFAQRAAAEADRVDNKACALVARSVIGEQRILLGQPESAIAVLEESADLAAYCDMAPVRIEFTRALLDSARAQCAGTTALSDRLDAALELARQGGDRFGEAEVLRQRARERVRCKGPTESALGDYAAAEAIFRALRARPDLAQTIEEHVEAARLAGRDQDAESLLAQGAELRASIVLPSG